MLVTEGYLPQIPYVDVMTFSALSATLLYLYRLKVPKGEKNQDFMFAIIR